MNIFKNILFLQDYPGDARPAAEPEQSYAQGYGNHVASAKAFAPLGHAHPIERSPVIASSRVTTLANDPCPVGACG